MKPYMKAFCDWAAERLADGQALSAAVLLSEYITTNYRYGRYISGAAMVSHALRVDKRFDRIKSHKPDEWFLKAE